jgi:hypothetical protein
MENDMPHARHPGADGELREGMGHQGEIGHRRERLVIKAGEGEGWEKQDENDGRRRTSEKKNVDHSWTKTKWNSWRMEGGYEMGCPTLKE